MRTLLTVIVFALLPSLALPAEPVDYLRDVKPLFLKNCVSCHGPDKQRGSLRLDTAASALKGGDTAPAVVPGKAAESLLIKAVTGVEDIKQMPPKGTKLTAQEIAIVRAWID